MMRVYRRCLWAQWGIWLLYAVGLLVMYVSGFFVNMLNARWLLLPATWVVIIVSIGTSLFIVGIFCYHKIAPGGAMLDKVNLVSAFPSFLILSTVLYYFILTQL